ncbi:hypothetical protein EXIGLDRAFT_264790 [Exidia glandulosa HHB12029]|uniref:Uncharacterized protein n=1 Tax=Exidia glandulosa HHB12029 TaxID=1314781 RepID=A0A165DQI5_EXIGL|nr:hypothetical protein EXIGLDRAFT_264790 [Exidia glandulosa HHB12029]
MQAPNHKSLFCSSTNPRSLVMQQWDRTPSGRVITVLRIRIHTTQTPQVGECTRVSYETSTADQTFAEMRWNDPRIGLGTVRIENGVDIPMQRLIHGRMQGSDGDQASFEFDSKRYVWHSNPTVNDPTSKTYTLTAYGAEARLANFYERWRSPDYMHNPSPSLFEYDDVRTSQRLLLMSIVALTILRWVDGGGGGFLRS